MMEEIFLCFLDFSAGVSCVPKKNFRFLPVAVDVDGVG